MLGHLFRARWSALFVLAMLCFATAGLLFYIMDSSEQDRAAALAAPQPPAVALDQYDRVRDKNLADEVHVLATLNPDFNYTLTMTHRRKKGRSYDEVQRMFVLFGPQDGADARVARAVVLLPEHQVEPFLSLIVAGLQDSLLTQTGLDPSRMAFHLAGFRDRSPSLDDMARDALAKEGLQTDDNFIFIEPWFEGRAAALAPSPSFRWAGLAVPGLPGLLLLVVAAYRFRNPHVPQVPLHTVAQVRRAPPSAAERMIKGIVRGVGRVIGMGLLVLAGLVGAFFYGPLVLIGAGALLVLWIKSGRRKPAETGAATATLAQKAQPDMPPTRDDWPKWAAVSLKKHDTTAKSPIPVPVAPAIVAKPRVKAPDISARFGSLTKSLPILRFAPFAIALVAMLALPQGRQALLASLGLASADPGQPAPSHSMTVATDLTGGLAGPLGAALALGLTFALAAGALWAHRNGLLPSLRKPVDSDFDPWARIEAERLRLE